MQGYYRLPFAVLLAVAAFAAAPARARYPATNAPALGSEAMAGAKAVLAAALRAPAPKAAPPAGTNDVTRYDAALETLDRRAAEGNGAVPAADWLAAVDCAMRLPADGANKPIRARLEDLVRRFPGPRDWDAVRAGLRERAAAAAGAPPPAGPWLLPALRTVADFLGEGGRGVPADAFAPFAAAAAPEGVDSNRLDRARAALRRAMEKPGEPSPAPFSLARFERKLDRALRGTTSEQLAWPEELEALPDETLAPLLRRALAGTTDGNGILGFQCLSSNMAARLVAAALADPAACGPAAWALTMPGYAGGRALFDALVAANDPLGAIRKRMREAAADAEDDVEDSLSAPRPIRAADVFGWRDFDTTLSLYAQSLPLLIGSALDDGRLDEAEALAAPLASADWDAVFVLGHMPRPERSFAAWRAFLEPRLPEGEDLLESPFLVRYAGVCRDEAPERYFEIVRARLGAAADTPDGTNVLEGFRVDVATRTGDLDTVEAAVRAEIERTGEGSPRWRYRSREERWGFALATMGETARLSDALDRILARLATQREEGSRWAPFWVVRSLAALGRFADAEALVRDALDATRTSYERLDNDSYNDEPAAELVWLYAQAGRPGDALAFAAGWPKWDHAQLGGDSLRVDPFSVPAMIAGAFAAAGRDDGAAFARFAATKSVASEWAVTGDWPFETLFSTTKPAETLPFLDGLLRVDPFAERLWRWKAEALRRAGDLAAAEVAARRAVALDRHEVDTGWHSMPDFEDGERGRSFETLAAVLAERGGAAAGAEAAALRRAADAARARAAGLKLWREDYRTNAVERYATAARLADGSPILRWLVAGKLPEGAEADAFAEAALRDLAAGGGGADLVWFGWERTNLAERVLPALAAAPGAAAAAHLLLGRLRKEQSRWEEAFAEYGRALALDPGSLDAVESMLGLRGEVERPAAEWGALQARLRRLDPCRKNHSEDARKIVDWPALWRAFEEAGAGPSLAWTPGVAPFFRFEATAKIEEAKEAAEKATAAAIAAAAGAQAADGDGENDNQSAAARPRLQNAFADASPAKMLKDAPWCRRLLDLASVLSGDKPRDAGRRGGGDDPWCLTAGAVSSDYASFGEAFCLGGDDDYFYDEW